MKTKALVKINGVTELRDYEIPLLNEVTIKVDYAGICRTDIYAAENKIETKNNLILGHEFSGHVIKSSNKQFKEGDYVGVNPIFDDLTMLGLDHNGCFSEYITLPSSCIYNCNGFDDNRVVAYIEPIAASLAPFKSKFITKEMVGAVYGENRIGYLTYELMIKNGYNIQIISDGTTVADNSFDYVIETLATKDTFDTLSRIIKRNGLLILKSRFPNHILVNFYNYVKKEIIIEPLYYHDFSFAVNYAKENYKDFIYLLGDSFDLSDWKQAFELSKSGDKKVFFKL